MIIGLSGKIGSGKDTVCGIIQSLLPGWENKKFSYKLKQVASILTGIPAEKFEDQEFKKSLLSREWNCILVTAAQGEGGDYILTDENASYFDLDGNECPNAYTVRQFLQRLGTEAIRDSLHPNSWVNALFCDYNKLAKFTACVMDFKENTCDVGESWVEKNEIWGQYPNWIITDVRFHNEFDAIIDRNGFVVRVIRDGVVNDSHASETTLDNRNFDYIINNNGTIEELEIEVKKMLQHFKLI